MTHTPSLSQRLSGFVPDMRIRALGETVTVYVVGGAVRDELLGFPASDRDWLVTGATPQQMEAAGFMPVGSDFPVFLHPDTHEEYALARTERKTGAGYRGFVFHAAPDVTLDADLQRRDLTINAMAMDAEGRLHDPWGGFADLQARVFRHVSPAFAEDPVRILRLARFAARFPDFQVAPDTLQFCMDMVNRGEARALVPERVWQEISRLLMARKPAAGWSVLCASGALPDIMDPSDAAQMAAITALEAATAHAGWTIAQRWAAWLLLSGLTQDAARRLSGHWRVPTECADLAQLCIAQYALWCEASRTQKQADLACMLAHADVYRRPERFAQALDVMVAARAEPGLAVATPGQAGQGHPAGLSAAGLASPLSAADWLALASAARALPMGDIARQAQQQGTPIPEAVAAARERAIGQALAGLVKS